MSYLPLVTNAAVTAVGPVAGSAQSTAALAPADYTLHVSAGLTGSRIRLGLEDSPDGTTWTPLHVLDLTGPVSQSDDNQREYRIPGLKTSATSQARVNLYEIVGGVATLNIGFQY